MADFRHVQVHDGLSACMCRYFYQVGDGHTWGPVLSFRSLKAPGQEYPQRLLLIADWCASCCACLSTLLASARAPILFVLYCIYMRSNLHVYASGKHDCGRMVACCRVM